VLDDYPMDYQEAFPLAELRPELLGLHLAMSEMSRRNRWDCILESCIGKERLTYRSLVAPRRLSCCWSLA
jgi:hypothetical protein